MNHLQSIQKHEKLKEIFSTAESRHLTNDEFTTYRAAVPEFNDLADAAMEIREHEAAVVQDTVEYIFRIYPFAEKHPGSSEKCPRDVSNVSAYATLAMLMNDADWYRDKLLLWLRTILQAFEFPERPRTAKKGLFSKNELTDKISELPKEIQSIYETYSKLKSNYKAALSTESYQRLEPYLSLTIDILTRK